MCSNMAKGTLLWIDIMYEIMQVFLVQHSFIFLNAPDIAMVLDVFKQDNFLTKKYVCNIYGR